jgi:type II secretory pathway component PulF
VTELLINISSVVREGTPPGWSSWRCRRCSSLVTYKLIRQAQIGRHDLDIITLKVPVVGQIAGKSSIARFTRTLGTLISAGVPILEAVTITRDTTGNEVYSNMLQQGARRIREGDSFANPLRASKTVDPIVVNMVDVGEETGELDKMLMKVADNYDEEVDTLVASLVSLLEPIMVVALGLIVGFIVVALFLPLVTLIQSVMTRPRPATSTRSSPTAPSSSTATSTSTPSPPARIPSKGRARARSFRAPSGLSSSSPAPTSAASSSSRPTSTTT